MKILKKFLWVLVFVYLVIAFLPKANIFYLAEDGLKKYNIAFNDEKIGDYLVFFRVFDAKMYYEGLHVGDVKSISIFPTIIYNQIGVKEANFSNSLKQFVPKEVKSLTLINTIFYPIKIWIRGDGDFGKISGSLNLYTKKLRLELKPTNSFLTNYKSLAKQFKKDKDIYVYETTYK